MELAADDLLTGALSPSLHIVRSEFIAYEGDASNQFALEAEKVHVGLVTILAFNNVNWCNEAVEGDLVSVGAQQMRSLADITGVKEGTTDEFLGIMEREFRSVGVATYRARLLQSRDNKTRLTSLLCSLDKGPENVGGMARLVKMGAGISNVCVHGGWCLFHQFHLIVESHLDICDNFSWGFVDGAKPYPTGFFSGLKIVCNTWRGPGVKAKIVKYTADAFGELVSRDFFSRSISRCIKGRWASVQSVQKVIDDASPWLNDVFHHVLPQSASRASGGPADEVEEDDRAKLGRWRGLTREMTANKLWLCTVTISRVTAEPMAHILYWSQKRVAEENQARDGWRSDIVFSGETFLSDFVCFKAAEVSAEISELLQPCSEAKFSSVWARLPAGVFSNALEFMVTLVVAESADWDRRAISVVSSFPLLFMKMLQKGPRELCPERRQLAEAFLKLDLGALQSKTSDLALKTREFFRAEFEEMRAAGRCPLQLWLHLLGFRFQMRGNNQYLEGLMNKIQTITRRAPNIRKALVNARMTLAVNARRSPEDYAQEHHRIQRYREEHGSHRFADVVQVRPTDDVLPAGLRRMPLERPQDVALASLVRVAPIAASMYRSRTMGASVVYILSACLPFNFEGTAFLMAKSFYSCVRCALGDIERSSHGDYSFRLRLPLEIRTLICIVGDEFEGLQRGVRASLFVGKAPAKWHTRSHATIDVGSIECSAHYGKQSRTPQAALSEIPLLDVEAGTAPEEDGENEEDDSLSMLLGEIIDQDLDEADFEDSLQPDAEGDVEADELDDDDSDGAEERVPHPLEAFSQEERLDVCRRVYAEACAWADRCDNAEKHARDQIAAWQDSCMDDRISLISAGTAASEECSLVFVLWKDYAAHSGERIRLDEQNRVIYDVGVKMEIFDNFGLVVQDTIALKYKATAAGRYLMPAWVMAIKKKVDAQMFQGPHPPQILRARPRPTDRSCLLCLQAKASLTAFAPLDDILFECVECTRAYHPQCVAQWRDVMTPGAPNVKITLPFRCPVCDRRLCSALDDVDTS